jgi:hypothetical protein
MRLQIKLSLFVIFISIDLYGQANSGMNVNGTDPVGLMRLQLP